MRQPASEDASYRQEQGEITMIELRRATFGWYRAVLAPNLVTGLIAFALLLLAVVSLALHYLFWNNWALQLFDYSGAIAAFVVAASFFAGYYGLMRGLTFHPALDYRYHSWLQASPWTPGNALPKGPITPVWQDGLLLTLLTLLTTVYASQTKQPTLTALGPTMMMAAGLALAWTAANFVTRNLVAVYATLFAGAASGLLLFDLQEASFAVCLVVAAVVAYVGVVVGMAGYPWQLFPRDKQYMKRLLNPHDQRQLGWQATATVGWPYMQFLVPPKDFRVSRTRAAMEACTVGLLAGYVGRFIPPRDTEVIWGVVGNLGFGLMIGKLLANVSLMCPKFCLGERLVRWRPIIWRHDRLLAEPLLVGGAMAAVAAVWQWLRIGPTWIGGGMTLAVGVWLARRLGRPVAERFYTGPQAIAGVHTNSATFKPLASPGE